MDSRLFIFIHHHVVAETFPGLCQHESETSRQNNKPNDAPIYIRYKYKCIKENCVLISMNVQIIIRKSLNIINEIRTLFG